MFQLQPVLTHRAAIERQRKMALAAIESERSSLQNELRDRQEQLVATKREWSDWLGRPGGGAMRSDLRAARFQASASLHMMAQAQRTVLKLAGVYQRLERARAELLAAATSRRAVELLRDRQFEEWRQNERRREDAALDELSVMGAARAKEAA